MFLTLPLSRLIRMYSHFLSVFLFGVAYKLSAIYVDLEMKTGEEELKLDGLIKLERHGFHFLAQVCFQNCHCKFLTKNFYLAGFSKIFGFTIIGYKQKLPHSSSFPLF